MRGLIDSQGQMITHGLLPEVSDEDGVVTVCFFKQEERLPEEFEDTPLVDLSNIPTPPTPTPREASE